MKPIETWPFIFFFSLYIMTIYMLYLYVCPDLFWRHHFQLYIKLDLPVWLMLFIRLQWFAFTSSIYICIWFNLKIGWLQTTGRRQDWIHSAIMCGTLQSLWRFGGEGEWLSRVQQPPSRLQSLSCSASWSPITVSSPAFPLSRTPYLMPWLN